MTRSEPTVSIGLPVRNGEPYVAEAIESLLAQTFGDFEILVSDNGSTDGTEAICREFTALDQRVRYQRSDLDRGASWNFNTVFKETRGRYFRWAAADDKNEPDYLRRCVDVLESDPTASLVFARSTEIDAHGRAVRIETIACPAGEARAAARARSFLFQYEFPKAAPFGLARRSQMRCTDLLGSYKSADRTFMLQMALLGRFHRLDEPLFMHREHPGRSVRLPPEQRLAWWDGGSPGRASRIWWRLARGYVEGTQHLDLPVTTRAEVEFYILAWMLRRASPLLREAWRGTAQDVGPAKTLSR